MSIPESYRLNTADGGGDAERILERISDSFYALDHAWRFTYVNAQAEILLRRTREELLGKCVWSEFPEAVGSGFDRQYRRAMAEQIPVFVEEFFPPLETWFEVRAYPSPDGLSVFFQNVNERKRAERQAERALQETNERFRTLYETMAQGVVYQDETGAVISANPAAERMLGLTVAEISGRISADPRWLAVREDGSDFPGEAHPAMAALSAGQPVLGVIMGVVNAQLGVRRWLRVNAIPQFRMGAKLPYQVYSTFEDITEERDAGTELRQTEQELRLAHERTTGILESITDAFYALDHEWRFTYVNAQAARLLFRKREELIGRNIWEEFPEAVNGSFYQFYHRAASEGVPLSLEDYYEPLDSWMDVRAFPSPEGLSIFFQNVSERRKAQEVLSASEEALRENESRLQDAQTRLEAALSAGGIATWTWDVVNDRVEGDTNFARLFCLNPEDMGRGEIDVYLQAIHPDDRPRVAGAIGDALAHGDVYEAEYRIAMPDHSQRWLAARGRVERDGDGRPVTLPGVVLDITERAERQQREQLLASIAERARGMTDPDAVIADAVRSVGQFLGVGRCVFGDIDLAADTCTIVADYCAPSVASIVGVFPFSDFGPFVVAEYMAGRAVSVDDVRLDPIRVIKSNVAMYESIGIRSHITAPVVHSSRLVSVIAVHHPAPRRWKLEEVELLQAVVERTWLTVEVLRQQIVLAREAEEQRARAEREALLNRIGQALRRSPDPKTVLETAVRELGEALSADRCYYAVYHPGSDTATLSPEWSRGHLPPIEGNYLMSRFAASRAPAYTAGITQALADTSSDPAILEMGITALVRVPLVSGFSMTALTVAMADAPRDWTAEEISLVEAVATQTQIALDAARVQRREHNIAEHLQSALQPALPQNIPGLEVGSFTRPALDEASIGGDFMDVFVLDKNRYAIVLGDVSGKGLAAAQQLALIRNTLRAMMYLYCAPAQAAAALSTIVTSHDLLIGFVTVWIGVYHAVTGEIIFCSCGHEPGLVRRAAGDMEVLETICPPLGIAENTQYLDRSITLASGDELLLYTDGLSEAGPSRLELLGTEGLLRRLASLPTGANIQSQAEALVSAAAAYSGGVFRDDVAVLLARRQ